MSATFINGEPHTDEEARKRLTLAWWQGLQKKAQAIEEEIEQRQRESRDVDDTIVLIRARQLRTAIDVRLCK